MTQDGETCRKEIHRKTSIVRNRPRRAMEKATLRQLVPPVSPDRRPPDTYTTSKGVAAVNLIPKSPVPGKTATDFVPRRQNFRRGTPPAARFAAFI